MPNEIIRFLSFFIKEDAIDIYLQYEKLYGSDISLLPTENSVYYYDFDGSLKFSFLGGIFFDFDTGKSYDILNFVDVVRGASKIRAN